MFEDKKHLYILELQINYKNMKIERFNYVHLIIKLGGKYGFTVFLVNFSYCTHTHILYLECTKLP